MRASIRRPPNPGVLMLTSTKPVSAPALGLLLAYASGTLTVCALACLGPTVRALRVEPTEALRAEG